MPISPISARTGVVTRVEWLSPHMVRLAVGGPGLREITAGECSDHYVKLQFPRPGVVYPEPFDLGVIRETMPRESWPVVRTYTIRRWLPEIPELWLDFVVHGDEGIAGPWAAAARVGDPVRFLGPGGGYAPDPAAGWHLLAGDESALPAIAAALEAMPAGARVHAFVEVAGPADEQPLATAADAEITWLYRGGRPIGEALVAAVRGLAWPAGSVQAFVHGEAGFVRDLRRLLRVEKQIPMDRLSISGYWRHGLNEDGWQSSKREWNRQVEAEQAA
ncbi:siderophore-interacting protein [Couchioplanes caeruleus]|uniref:NADPH-dependent ferric siderophore reductase n=2 Tax=Couchioplanes caeruleus TaxID=56438 RepID=A0A1K0FGM6_9ACTN|nr:siderophore-interacting protein [Couchioplanes caeruleus]OJF11872.1 NADPH-dependent ferric siderophore reductase [Couchioplanes caeruleus subsp. caeruleus]ROP34119.1 NADPH-dependent ferric siderophore reductase [Couchioplanes caeruleus]